MTVMLTDGLHDAFIEIGILARADGKVIDLAVYGESAPALMLASNFRDTTRDVDAVVSADQSLIDRLARIVAARRGWPADWLNDGVRTYLSPNVEGVREHHQLFRSYPSEQEPGLRVFVPTAEYILAMKLMAMRLDEAAGKSDLDDIINLLDVVEITTPEAATEFAAEFYPEARISARLLLGLQELWRLKHQREKPDEPPAYLGRSRASP
jgi:hypothetical protein